jgi:hypothetical protein
MNKPDPWEHFPPIEWLIELADEHAHDEECVESDGPVIELNEKVGTLEQANSELECWCRKWLIGVVS